MDVNEASAMTEASGLVDGQEQTADVRRPQSASQDVALAWADRLRMVAVQAPLQSLAVAFVLGMWFARRR